MASIQKRPNGQWRARYRDDAGKEHARHFQRKVDAQRWLDEVTTAVGTGTYLDPRAGSSTVGDYGTRWLAGRVHLKPKTRAGYESLLKTRLLPRWGAVPLSRVSYGDVSVWVSEMGAEGLSASRTRQAYHLLTAVLDYAVKDSQLARNPAAGVQLPRMRTTERRFLTHEQVDDLAEAAGAQRVLVLTLAYCGLRWGEAVALRVRRLDLLRGRIDVDEAVVDVNGTLIFGTPKSHQSRSVPVPRFLCELLAEHVAGRARDGLVFTSPEGTVLRSSNFRRRGFDRAATEAGLNGLTPHELRHTAASLAIASGASVKAVQRMLGHSSATLTLDRYGHLFGDELDAVADRLSEHRADSLRTGRVSGTVVKLAAGR